MTVAWGILSAIGGVLLVVLLPYVMYRYIVWVIKRPDSVQDLHRIANSLERLADQKDHQQD